MADKITKKAFIELCKGGLNTKHFTTYVKRQTILLDNNGLIDIDNPINELFIAKCLAKVESKPVAEPVKEVPAVKEIPVKPKKKPRQNKTSNLRYLDEVPETNSEPSTVDVLKMSLVQLEKEKAIQNALKLREEVKIKNIQREKLEGTVIPIDLTRSVLARFMKIITASYKQSADDIILGIAHEFGASNEVISSAKSTLVDSINLAVDNAYDIALKELRNIVDEYSETRTKGERRS